MKVKEKALDLTMKFDKLGETDNAKQCALIAVDEILSVVYIYNDTQVEYQYWQEVKQEIEKL